MTINVSNKKWSNKKKILMILALIGVILGYTAWYKFFREVDQPAWVTATPEMRFKYGSIGGENDAGIPYWIFVVLPRLFPEHLPGNGGYASLGVPWEEGKELPVGFTKKTIGFPRVANNCAVCHTASYRITDQSKAVLEIAGPSHTTDIEGFFKFVIDCAKDPKFNADSILEQIAMVHELSFLDKLIYRFLIIPITKKRLIEREEQFQWIYRDDFPNWGKGRDDAMNLTKYFMIGEPMDDTFGPSDMPSVWNLKKYDGQDKKMNWDGASHNAYSVIMDSALGLLGAEPKSNAEFIEQVNWLLDYLRNKQAPAYPFNIDEELAQSGAVIFDQQCARCHNSEQTGTPIPISEINTSKNRLATWKKKYAVAANKVVEDMGLERDGLVEEELIGYVAVHLDGIWLRAPYLHNGSVPSIADLLKPTIERPKTFYRGYNVYDQDKLGFISIGDAAAKTGTLFNVDDMGNSNQGHEFGVTLLENEKQALIEYMKTL